MTLGGSPFLWGALLFLAGLIVGAIGSGIVFGPGGERLDVEARSTTIKAPAPEIEGLTTAREAEPSQQVGNPMLNADHEPSRDVGNTVVAIGPPMDADADFFIPSSNDDDGKVVQIGEPRDVDAPP